MYISHHISALKINRCFFWVSVFLFIRIVWLLEITKNNNCVMSDVKKIYNFAQLAPESAAWSEVSVCCCRLNHWENKNEGFISGRPLSCLLGWRPVARPSECVSQPWPGGCLFELTRLCVADSTCPPSTPAAGSLWVWSVVHTGRSWELRPS